MSYLPALDADDAVGDSSRRPVVCFHPHQYACELQAAIPRRVYDATYNSTLNEYWTVNVVMAECVDDILSNTQRPP